METINFAGCSEVSELQNVPWPSSTTKYVEFFPYYFTKVTFIQSVSPSLGFLLKEIDDGYPVFFDQEWKPDHFNNRNDVSVMQFATSKGVAVVQIIPHEEDKTLLEFINHHKFIGKGTHNDRQKLIQKFGSALHLELEDVEVTRLKPRGISLNFDEMVHNYAGNPSISFKDKTITLSDWSAPMLSTPQILYAAFDVVALQRVAAKLPIFKKEQRRKASLLPQIKVSRRYYSDGSKPLNITYSASNPQ